MKSNPSEKVKCTNQTKNQFYAYNENNFLVLPDNKTIVGVHNKIAKTLIMEDITTNKASTFGNYEDRIYTLLYDEVTQSLFAGYLTGHVKQYKRDTTTNAFSLVKDYGNVDIGMMFSSAQVGRFALFGGRKRALVAIDIHERRLCNKIRSAFGFALSLRVCQGVDQKVYLSVGGGLPEYSSSVSDFLDVTRMYDYKKESSVLDEKPMQPKKEEENVK